MIELVESPWPAIFFGIFATTILAMALVRTGRGVLLLAMVVVLVLTLGAVGLEQVVVTERERVEDTLYGAAAAIEANDLDRLMPLLAGTARVSLNRARSVFHQYKFTEARITSVEIEINDLTSPPTAEAKTICAFSLIDTQAGLPYNNGRIGLTIQLQRESDRWRITGHSEDNLRDYF